MSLWRQLTRGLRALTNRAATDQDVTDEVGDYLARATAAHVARGLPRDAALRAARLELGNVTAARERVREYGWENLVETVLADLRYAFRRLRTTPGFTAVTVLTLAVGIGATTAILGVVNPILFRPLPYPDPGRIVTVWEATTGGPRIQGTFGTFRQLEERARSFEAIAVLTPWTPTMTGPAEPERLEGQRVSASYFRVLAVRPAFGQDFQASDDHRGGPRVVLLSDALWRRRFAADQGIIGRSITLDGDPYVVIGVMPKRFENATAPAAELWTLLQTDMADGGAWGHYLRTVGRLRAGVGIDRAKRELAALAPDLVPLAAAANAYFPGGFVVTPLHDEVTHAVRPALLGIFGAVLLVLAIVCVNVTNLLLARGERRRAEFALRAALGARHGRLVRQLLTESLVLAAAGGATGMVVASFGIRALVAVSPPGLPRLGAIGVDRTVYALGMAITTVIGLAFGLIPALQAARSDPHRHLQHGTRSAGGHQRTRSTLVVAEVALALVLLVSSGLLLRSLGRLFAVAPGFDAPSLLTMQVQTAGRRFAQDTATSRFFAQALEAVRGVPGVTAAAFTSQLPLSGDLDEYGVHFELSPTEHAEGGSTYRYAVSPGYIELMHIPLRRGRLFDAHDRAGSTRVALLSESFARRMFPVGDAIGRRLRIGPTDGPTFTVVGVVGDVRQVSLALSQSDAVYIPATQWLYPDNAMSLVVRARAPVAALAPAIRRAVWSVDKDQPIVRVATMDALLAVSGGERHFALIVFEAFALVALLLAAMGIYGVLSGGVTERTREIGVRSALGASRAEILSLVVRRGMTLTGLGIALGLVGAVIASRALITLLFGVSRLDPLTYAGVVLLLAFVAALASGIPAWRAARIDPAIALRSE